MASKFKEGGIGSRRAIGVPCVATRRGTTERRGHNAAPQRLQSAGNQGAACSLAERKGHCHCSQNPLNLPSRCRRSSRIGSPEWPLRGPCHRRAIARSSSGWSRRKRLLSVKLGAPWQCKPCGQTKHWLHRGCAHSGHLRFAAGHQQPQLPQNFNALRWVFSERASRRFIAKLLRTPSDCLEPSFVEGSLASPSPPA